MKKILLTFTFIISIQLAAETSSERVNSKDELIKLNSSEMLLIEKKGTNTAELKHRYFELMSEKISFIREKENKSYLQLNIETRKSKIKDDFFIDSKNYYEKTKKYGLDLISKNKNYAHKAEVYYTLALNSRDFSKDKEEEIYFLEALKYSNRASNVSHQSYIGLAEFYYNEKKFNEAHKYYALIIQNTTDNWLPKHLYNMAWCELKLKMFSSSVELMKRAYELSKNPRYLSNSEDILQHIGMFYILANNAQEAIDFYIKKNERTAYYLYKLAKNVAEKGQYNLAQTTILQALKIKNDDKADKNLLGDIRLFQLEFYRNFAQTDLFIETAKSLSEEKTEASQKEESIQRIREYSGYLQIRLTENAKKNIKNYDQKQLERILQLFELLKTIDPPKAFQYAYFQGETNYSVQKYTEAIINYEESLKLTSKNDIGNEDIRKTISSLLGLLDDANLTDEEKKSHYIIAYSEHIRLWPKDEKSRLIYPKLFFLVKPLDVVKAKDIFEKFVENFPTDQNIQQELCLALMDDHAEKGDVANLAKWTAKMDKGFLSFTQDKIEKAVGVLGHLLFESIEKKTDKKSAIADYLDLYNNPRYPQKIKAKSAFNASNLYLEENETKKSFEWFSKSLDLYADDDISELRPLLVSMALKFALRLDLENAKAILENYLKKTKKEGQQDQSLWEHYFLFSLALSKNDEAIDFFKTKNLLSINDQKKAELAFAKKLFLFGDLDNFKKTAEKLQKKELNSYYNSAIERLYYQNKITKSELTQSNYSTLPFVKNISIIDAYEKELRLFEKKRLKIASKFKEQHFNWALEDYLLKLKETVQHGEQILKTVDRESAITLSTLIPEAYMTASTHLENLEYEKIPKDMRDSFKDVMFKMASNFKNEGQILKEKIIAATNTSFTFTQKKLSFKNTSIDLTHKIESFVLKNLDYDKDCELIKSPQWKERENWNYWSKISGCYLSLGNINTAIFYKGLSDEYSKMSNDEKTGLLKLKGALFASKANWDEANNQFIDAKSSYNLILLGFTYGQHEKVEEYYLKQDLKNQTTLDALELLKELKGVSYARNE